MDHSADTVVVGGGIAGLLAAITAAPAGERRHVVLLEPHPLGGRARADVRDGFTFNRGPRALYVGGPAERALTDLGVALPGAPPTMTGALAIAEGVGHRFPSGAAALARTQLLDPAEKMATVRTLAAIASPAKRAISGVSLAAWLDGRWLPGRSRHLVEALVRVSTYANAPEAMDAGTALDATGAALRRGVRYLDGGWQPIVDQLHRLAEARGVQVRALAATAVRAAPDGQVTITTSEGTIAAGAAVIATGGPAAAAAVLGAPPASWPTLGPPATVACLELGVRRPPPHRFALGVDEPIYASTHAPPADLAPPGQAVVHLMRYQPPDDPLGPEDQRDALERLATAIGVAPGDIVSQRFLASMVVTGALPRPSAAAGGARPSVVVPEHPGVFLAGDWVGPHGLLLDAAAHSAAAAGAAARGAIMVAP